MTGGHDHDGARGAVRRAVIIGVGNENRGDDGIGIITARRIRRVLGDTIPIFENDGDGAALIEQWRSAELAIVIDAAHGGDRIGQIKKFSADENPLPAITFPKGSTHNFGLIEAVETAQALGTLPRKLIIYVIEGDSFAFGAAVSPEVLESVGPLIEDIRLLLRREGFTA